MVFIERLKCRFHWIMKCLYRCHSKTFAVNAFSTHTYTQNPFEMRAVEPKKKKTANVYLESMNNLDICIVSALVITPTH